MEYLTFQAQYTMQEDGTVDVTVLKNATEEEVETTDYAFYPRKYHHLDKYYEKLRDSYWVPAEIDFSADREDWERLSKDAKNKNTLKFVEHILAFFAQADGIVNENLIDNFQRDTSDTKEAQSFYIMQAANELIHSETYGLQIETLIHNPLKKQRMYQAIRNYPSIKKISEWVFTYMNKERHILERILGFCCVEGILFTAAFCAIYWIKKMNIFRGLWKSNEFIARDEALHTEFGTVLYHHYTSFVKKYEPLSDAKIIEIIRSAVETSENFVRDALMVDLIGMSAEDMIKYVKSTANSLGRSFGLKEKIYEVDNPFDWMAVISLPNKTNFFEDEVSEYSKISTAGGDGGQGEMVETEIF